MNFKIFDPEVDTLCFCIYCGIVYDKDTVKSCERDEDDCKVAFMECPACNVRVEVDYDY